MTYSNSIGSNQTAHLCSLIRTFAVFTCMDAMKSTRMITDLKDCIDLLICMSFGY